MSKLENRLVEELIIRKAKYRVKNSEDKYEVVYLETSADQVEQTSDRVFVTPEEKSQITSNKEAIAAETQAREAAVNAINGKLDVINGNEETTGSISKALKDAKAYADEKVQEVNEANSDLSGRVEAVEQKVEAVDGKISAAKTEAVESAKTYTDDEIGKIDTAYKAADAKVLEDAKADAQAKVQKAKTELESSISNVYGKIDSNKTELDNSIKALTGKVTTNESDIQNLKNAVANKNNNTIVVNTEDEIVTTNANPKVGDMAYVISTKRAYIYKGVDALSAKAVPQGWVVFDEITSELDLVNYLKKSEAEATYRKLSAKIAESDLATELVNKIDAKADKSYVDGELAGKTDEAYVNSKVEEVVAPVRTESAQNKADIAKEVEDRKFEDIKLNHRISKFVPVVASEEPADTEAGHVWLEIQA